MIGLAIMVYEPLDPYMVSVRVSFKLEASLDFFSRSPQQIVLIHLLGYQKMQFHREKKNEQSKGL